MSTISKSLTGILFNGAALALASAQWKSNVRAIYGFNASGNGYQVFKPASGFNSLTHLSQDGVYIVDAATPGFELPGAVLSAGVPASVPAAVPTMLSLNTMNARIKPNGYATVSVNVDGADQLRIGSLVVAVNGTEQIIDTDPAGVLYEQMADEGGIPLEFLRNGQVLLSYPFYARA
jgi:hypothetical protein